MVNVVIDGGWAGYITIGDRVRPGSAGAVAALRGQRVERIALLSGDGTEAVTAAGQRIGIGELHANLLPDQKVEILERILADRHGAGATAFVGDGINDAPVLARADVGIAMGGAGADAAVETADVVLMGDDPGLVPEAIARARRTRTIVVENIIFAVGVKAAFLGLGALGVATMWEAVIADMGVALVAIVNATRAMR